MPLIRTKHGLEWREPRANWDAYRARTALCPYAQRATFNETLQAICDRIHALNGPFNPQSGLKPLARRFRFTDLETQ